MTNRNFKSLGSFGDAFARWAKDEPPERVSIAKRRVALGIHGRVSRRTPRDTGRAAAAWDVSRGTPSDFVPAEGRYGPPAPPNVELSDAGESLWVVNNLDYIVPLNNGHSDQAPAGFVEQSVQEEYASFEKAERDGL